MGDPTPLEYDDPIEHVEWGVAIPKTGESLRLLDEDLARLAAEGRDDLVLMRRRVVYDPWQVVAKDHPARNPHER